MDLNKKVHRLTVWVIVLGVLVVSFLGYFCYEQIVLKNKESNSSEIKKPIENSNEHSEESSLQKDPELEEGNSQEDVNSNFDGEIVTKIVLDDSGRTISIVDGAIVVSDANTLTLEDDAFISLGESFTCGGNYHLYALTKQGKLFVNYETVRDFVKFEGVEVETSEPILAMKSYALESQTCGSQYLSFVGESHTVYYPEMECGLNHDHVKKVGFTTDRKKSEESIQVCIPK